jgi:hypothetical protein
MTKNRKPQPALPDDGMEQGDAYDPSILEDREDFDKNGELQELEAADEVDKNEHVRSHIIKHN